jgi:hypothetical protein
MCSARTSNALQVRRGGRLRPGLGGVVPRGFQGQAAYFGPTFHYQINEKIDLSGAALVQAPTGRLGFGDSPRELAKLRLEVEF